MTSTEDLTRSLQGHNHQIVVSVDGQGFLNLNRATVHAKNTGNVSLESLKFDIEIPGEHHSYLANLIEGDRELRRVVDIAMDQPPAYFNPTFHVNVGSFLNANEVLGIAVFFDNAAYDCIVRCRLPGVKTRTRVGKPLTRREFWLARGVETIALVNGIVMLVCFVAGVILGLLAGASLVVSFVKQVFR